MGRRLALIFVVAMAFSCSPPPSIEPFIIRERAEYGDTYSFNLDLDDSLSHYSLDFYTRMSRKPFQPFEGDSLHLNIRWVTPSDSSIMETAVLPLNGLIDSSYYSRDYVMPFRDTLQVSENGVWRLRVQVRDPYEDMRGLGIILKNKKNGAR